MGDIIKLLLSLDDQILQAWSCRGEGRLTMVDWLLQQLTTGTSSVSVWLSATAGKWMHHSSRVHWQDPLAVLEHGMQTWHALAVEHA